VGAFFGYTDGQTNAMGGRSELRGNTFGLLADGSTVMGGRSIGLRAAVSFGDFSYDMDRNGSRAADREMSTTSAELSAYTYLYDSRELSFGPEISLAYGRAKTSAFDETGGNLPLSVAASSNERLVSAVGLKLTYQLTSSVVMTARAGWEHECADASSVEANFAGGTGSGFSAIATQSRNTAVGGLDLGVRLPGAYTLHLTGEVRDNRQFNRNVVLGAALNRRF
jgi:outer membrane autotransporter protein